MRISKANEINNSKWIRIDNNIFDVDSWEVQLSIGSHANISITIDINKNPGYYQFFIKTYEDSKKFDIYNTMFLAKGSHIKSMDISFNNEITLSIVCDLLEPIDTQVRRDEIIDDLLNDKTLSKDNNIT